MSDSVATARRREIEIEIEGLEALSSERLEAMLAAGDEVLECQRVLTKGGLNVVGELLKGQGKFYELNHYPKGDVHDKETGAQYYYHAHRGMAGEHGHFHTFLRRPGIPPDIEPVAYEGKVRWPTGKDAVCHLVAVSMDKYGYPIGLFSTNRWVTDEAWYEAAAVIGMLDQFDIDHAYPSWPVNRWLSSLFRLFRPEISALLRHRDRVVDAWRDQHPGTDVFEDRKLEVTGELRISVKKRIASLRARLD